MSAQLQQDSTAWLAQLALRYEYRAPRTVIAARKHQGPLTIQKPFYPEQDVCHTYLLHPPGGVVGGDILKLDVELGDQAHALLTTPASGKFYRSENKFAQQQNHFRVSGSGVLEWLPQETILFANSRVKTRTLVDLAANAKYVGWEIICLGRPASGDHYEQGYCEQLLTLTRAQQPLIIDRIVFDGSDISRQAKWGLAGYSVSGVMTMTNCDKDMLNKARAAIYEFTGLCACTLLGEVLVCRYLGYHGIQARELFTRIWSQLRPAWCGREAHEPRIWAT
jgi:urease accessory protein